MPRQRQPPSLREASIMSIVRNLEDYWCAVESIALLENSGQSEVFTPFQYLRDDMIQEIIDMVYKMGLLRSYHFKLLLHSNIQRLNLAGPLRRASQLSLIETLGTRCQKLTHLTIDLYCDQHWTVFHFEKLCTLFSNMPLLISLDLGGTILNADVLKVISENCPNLLDLNGRLSQWRLKCRLSDEYLLYFCNLPTRPQNLPKLRHLSLTEHLKNPSADTVSHLLNSHPSLRCLDIPGIDHAFEQMYGEKFQSLKKVPPEWIHNLLDITIYGKSVKRIKSILSEVDRLNLTFQCCPFLTKLCLLEIEERESLNNISKLKHLTQLRVSIVVPRLPYQKDKFTSLMFSVLTEIGHNLISLECKDFDEVSLITIGKLCPKLESLKLDMTGFVSEHDLMEDYRINPFSCFTNLKVINISKPYSSDGESPSFVDKEALSLLLQNATEITQIFLHDISNITDNIISSPYKKHSFRHLKQFTLVECSPISEQSVWKLLSADNPLEDLYVSGCDNITCDDMNHVRDEVELRQFKLKINIDC